MHKIYIIISLIFSIPFSGLAQDSRNGYWVPPYDTLRILVVYAELTNDPDDPVSVRGWEQGEIPPVPDYLFDYQLPAGKEPEGVITRYYHQASFGKYIVLADYYPEIISIDFKQVKGNGFDQVIERLMEVSGGDIITSHGYSVNAHDFDRISTSSHGQLKPLEADSYIDMFMIIWRVNSKITTTMGAGYCYPSKRNYTMGEMKGMNSSSSFVMKDFHGYTTLRHEFSHLLLGGNNFHTGGAGAGTKTFMSSAGGYAMLSSWDKFSLVYNSFDRRRLGWKHPENQFMISARDPLTGNEMNGDLKYDQSFENAAGEFILRDFVEYGDAIRIELPYLRTSSDKVHRQWLWLENHQRPEGFIDHDKSSSKGIYAYIQVGKEELTGPSTFRGNCNYTWPLSAFGNYDYQVNEANEDAITGDEFRNPFTGYNNLIRGAYDRGEKDGKILRDESLFAKNLKFNGEYLDSSVYKYMTYPMLGTSLDAFLPGQEIGIDRNPAAVPLLTWQTGYSQRRGASPAVHDNRIIHLNGLSVKILEQLPDGNVRVGIQWDEREVGRDVRWCGNIQLHEDLVMNKGVRVQIDHGLTPQKPSNPLILNGNSVFSDPSSFTLNPGSSMEMDKKSRLILENGSSLELSEGSNLIMDRGSRIIISDSCNLKIHPGANISGKGRIYLSGDSSTDFDQESVQVRFRTLK